MKTIYKSKKYPNTYSILISYISKYGLWILALWLFLIIISGGFFLTLSFIIYFLFIPFSFFIYGRGYQKDRIVYMVEVDNIKKEIILHSYTLWKYRTIIPFDKLFFECYKKQTSLGDEQWRIIFGKKPSPVVGTIKSGSNSSAWSNETIRTLAFELNQIKFNYSIWKPRKISTFDALHPGKNSKIVENFD